MTDPSPAAAHGRHRSPAARNRTLIVVAVVVALVAAAGVITWLVRSRSSAEPAPAGPAAVTASPTGSPFGGAASSAPVSTPVSAGARCPDEPLTVAVTPDLAPTLTAFAGPQDLTVAGCPVRIESADPAAVVDGSVGADVWIPDSSIWLPRATAAGRTVGPDAPSIATSPVVFALSDQARQQLAAAGASIDVAGILATRRTAAPIRVGLPDPQRSAAAVAATLSARAAVSGAADARPALTWAVRSSPADLPIEAEQLLARLATDPGTAVPVTEQSLVAHNEADPATSASAVYPGPGGFAMDFPVVAVGGDPAAAAAARELATALTTDPARTALLAAGFRAPDQSPGPAISAADGVDPGYRETSDPPTAQAVDEAVRSVQVTNEGTRMLAVMDISGSMLAQVPGTNGADRIDLAKDAAARGLGLYRADSDIGLWEFSTRLTPTSDHRELIPISSLGPDGQGGSGAARLAAALNGLQAIPNGGTGLYDTVLEATRTVRAGYDPDRVNVVLLLTDGMNDDSTSITMDQLLSTLAAEQDPAKPVPVISIAFGPDSDVAALQQISRATGGATYLSQDPRQIGEIFLDAVGQRLCRPSC